MTDTTQDFSGFNLPESLLHSLQRMNFTTPTPIQAAAIPLAMQGRDILGSAQTGTGKTGAFCIPTVAKLLEDSKSTALIMTPTRELAAQVVDALKQMVPVANIKTALLIGGEPIHKQFSQLKMRPRIIVGTPGRINDHLLRQTLNLSQTRFLVLDETDRMLDMGFGVQIDKILEYVPNQRQTLLFSATLPSAIVKLSSRYMTNPERIAVGSTTAPAANIKQEVIHTPEAKKYDHLLEQLDQREGSVIVFVKTKHGADRLADKLCREEHRADAIHGDLQQRKRDRVIQNFRDKKNRILVATDVAARGLDIPHIEHVINYDLPQVAEDYIHRIGRTARAGAEGAAVNMVTPSDGAKWKAILRLINPEEAKKQDSYFKEEGGKSRGGKFGAKKPSFRNDRSERNEYPSERRARPSDDRGRFGSKSSGDARHGNGDRNRANDDQFPGYSRKDDNPFRRTASQFVKTAGRSNDRFDDRPRSNDRFDERPRSNNRFDDRPRSNDRFDDRPRSNNRFGDKPAGRPFGDKPAARSFGDKPAGRSFGDKPAGRAGKPFGKPGGGAGKFGAAKPGGFKKRFAGGASAGKSKKWA